MRNVTFKCHANSLLVLPIISKTVELNGLEYAQNRETLPLNF